MSRKNTKIETAKNSTASPIYHEDDKEGLRKFLKQPSMRYGDINAERLGLCYSDTTDWQNSEEWVAKITNLTWNNKSPKRLIKIDWSEKNLEGSLDASKWKELTYLDCSSNLLTSIDVSANMKFTELFLEPMCKLPE